MLLWSLLTLTISFSFSFILASTPLSMGLWVLLLALSVSSNIALLFSSWFSLIVFLIYIGGMLVMFAYFTALMPNQPLEMLKMLSMLFSTFFIVFISLFTSSSCNNLFSISSIANPSTALLQSMNIPIFLLIALILFFILVAVVKVANIYSGPLRPFN